MNKVLRSVAVLGVAILVVVGAACGKIDNSMAPTPDQQPLSITPIDPQIGVGSSMAVEVSSASAGLQPVVLEGQVGVKRLSQAITTSFWSLSGEAPGPFLVEFRDNGQTGRVSGTVHNGAFVRLVPNEALSPGTSQPCGGTYRVNQDIIFWVDAILGPGEAWGNVSLSFYDSQGQEPSSSSNGMGGPDIFSGTRFRKGAIVWKPVQVTEVIAILHGDGGYADVLTQASYSCQINIVPG